jgi:hypothetical protein
MTYDCDLAHLVMVVSKILYVVFIACRGFGDHEQAVIAMLASFSGFEASIVFYSVNVLTEAEYLLRLKFLN